MKYRFSFSVSQIKYTGCLCVGVAKASLLLALSVSKVIISISLSTHVFILLFRGLVIRVVIGICHQVGLEFEQGAVSLGSLSPRPKLGIPDSHRSSMLRQWSRLSNFPWR